MADERFKRLVARREQTAREREEILAKRKAITDLAEEEAREDLLPEEDSEFREFTGQVKAKDEELRALDERISELSDEAERSRTVTEGAAAVKRRYCGKLQASRGPHGRGSEISDRFPHRGDRNRWRDDPRPGRWPRAGGHLSAWLRRHR